MIFIVGSAAPRLLVSGFGPHASPKPSSTRLSASFFENLTKAFTTSSLMKKPASPYYTIGITGSGGLVGTALRNELLNRKQVNGKPVRIVKLTRSVSVSDNDKDLVNGAEPLSEISVSWNPRGDSMETILPFVSELDAVVHLAGENIATGSGPLGFLGIRPWNDEKKQEILNSRVMSSRALSRALSSVQESKVLLAASGVGAYGKNFISNARDAVDETMDISTSDGFLAEVSRQAEAASQPPTSGSQYRVVNMRLGVVLSTKGGALAKLAPIFSLGGGGNVGSGRQYFSFIAARDVARGIIHTLETPSLQGPVNFCAPNPCTNAEFTQALGRALNRPAIIPLPEFVVSLLFGEMGEETLLGGVRAVPTKLTTSGFTFLYPTINESIKSAMEEKEI